MEKILFLAHTQTDGALPRIALETLTAAAELSQNLDGSTLAVGLIGEKVQAAADSIAGCGASDFMGVEGKEFSASRYASDAAAAEALAREAGATLILAPGTPRFSRTLPGVTVRLQGRVDTHVSGLSVSEGELQIQRWYYRQRMVATLTRQQRPWLLLFDTSVSRPWEGESGSASIRILPVEIAQNLQRTQVAGIKAPPAEAQTIRPDAEVLFVAGAGWTKKQADGQAHIKEAEKLILDFINLKQASLGSSKSLVDQATEGQEVLSCMSRLNQVGQTGSTPRHPKGLATCCHGEEPHVVGWRFVNERRAVNLDPNCGWAQGKTDVLYVADAFEVISKLNELLSK